MLNFSPSKVPIIIDRPKPTQTVFSACVEYARCEASAISLQWKPRYRRKPTFFYK